MGEEEFEIQIVQGSEGPHISLNDYRIAGPKAFGGGRITHSWKITKSDLLNAVPSLRGAS